MQRRRSLQTRAKVSFLNTFHNNVFQERNFFFSMHSFANEPELLVEGMVCQHARQKTGNWKSVSKRKSKKTIEPMRISSLKETISWFGCLYSMSIRVQLFKICSLFQKRQLVFIPSIAYVLLPSWIARKASEPL